MDNTHSNTFDESTRTGESICRGRDWRWVALWAYNLHRLLRPAMKKRQIWGELDALIRAEWDWHLGRDLFHQIRQETLAQQKDEAESAEHAYLLLGEVTAKCISNASWSPGLFDYNCPWQVPKLAFQVADRMGDGKQADFLRHHFTSLASNRYSDSPGKRSSTISETTTNRMTLFFDPNDPDLRAKIEALVPTPGYCVLVDMVGSTAMKDAPILQWAPKIHNAFANTMAFLDPSIRPLKSIGDELMFYITCEQMTQLGEGPLGLYSGLFSVAGEPDPLFTDVKIAIAYCENAYPLSFLQGADDVYGKDIDLTARLLSKAQPREIVMNEPFARLVKADFNATGNQDQFPEVGRIKGPFPEDLKGFATPVPVFKAVAR